MLQPKKTKFRRQQKGRMKGLAQRGNQLAFGSFGIKTLENCWLTGRQIEAARQAVVRYMKREGKVRVILRDSFVLLLRAVSLSKLRAFLWKSRRRHSVWGRRSFRLQPSLWCAGTMLNNFNGEKK